jgi:hypothetical protein
MIGGTALINTASSPLAILRHVSSDFPTSGRMANVNGVSKIQLLDQFGDGGGIGVHLVTGDRLNGVSAPVR